MQKSSLRFIMAILCLSLFLSIPAAGQDRGALSVRDFAPVFGTGKIKVRLYADYYCTPCRALEPKIEPVLADLVKRNVITLTLIDAPFHKNSSLYTKYFLFIAKERADIDYILRARSLLFEASKSGITEQGQLEDYLNKHFLRFKLFDVKPVFVMLEGYIKEDKIMETPSCVIINGDKKEVYKGGADIIKALTSLK